MSRRRRALGLALLALLSLWPAGRVEAEPVPVRRAAGVGAVRLDVELGGALVSALAPGAGEALLLLVRPAAEVDGPRRLLRFALEPEPRLELLAEGLPGWTKTLVAIDLGAGPELLVGGLVHLVSLGPLAAPGGVARSLGDHRGRDLRSVSPGPLRRGVETVLAAAEAGRLRLWSSDGAGALRPARELPIPLAVERTATGLRLTSPPVTALPGARSLWLAGPAAVGRTRLRSLLVEGGAAGDPAEVWSSLPGPEAVEQSWPLAVDGVPLLVVRTQGTGAIDLFERQRLRVLPLAGDRTRAGRAPSLAVELDSKRWHATEIAAGDVDADGHADLLAAFPEGLTGGDLVVQWWRGRGGGRFESRARRTDLAAPASALELASPATGARPGVWLAGREAIELYLFASAGGRALEREPQLRVDAPPESTAPAGGRVRVEVGDTEREGEREAGSLALLGVAEIDELPGPELVGISADEGGSERLILVTPRPPRVAG